MNSGRTVFAERLAVSEATIRRVLRQAGLQRRIPPVPEGSLDQLDSDQHRRMVQDFVAGIEKLPK